MHAAISLLTDADAKVRRACQAQILAWDEHVRPLLAEVSRGADSPLRRSAAGMLRELDLRSWQVEVQGFADRMPRVGTMAWGELQEGALLMSRMARAPGSQDMAATAATLAGYADEVRPLVAGKSATTAARALASYLSSQIGYGGSHSSYYEASNVHFDQVVTSRRGVPVTLALLYLIVGRQAGLEVSGVAIPDHYLVRVHGSRPVLLDPYHEGRQVTKADCVRHLRQAGYSLHTTSYLEDVSDCRILDCLLRNLLRVYGYREDNELCTALEDARRLLVRT